MAAVQLKLLIPSLPDEFNPPKDFTFPKCAFGSRCVKYFTQRNWFITWHFLHYDESQDIVYCHITAIKLDTMRWSSNVTDTFVVKGFSKWKGATSSFKKLEHICFFSVNLIIIIMLV